MSSIRSSRSGCLRLFRRSNDRQRRQPTPSTVARLPGSASGHPSLHKFSSVVIAVVRAASSTNGALHVRLKPWPWPSLLTRLLAGSVDSWRRPETCGPAGMAGYVGVGVGLNGRREDTHDGGVNPRPRQLARVSSTGKTGGLRDRRKPGNRERLCDRRQLSTVDRPG
jgi:hypothetical protein